MQILSSIGTCSPRPMLLRMHAAMLAGGLLLMLSANAAGQATQPAATETTEGTTVVAEEYTGHPSQASAGGYEPRVIPERAGLLKWGPITLIEPAAKDLEKWASEELRLDLGFRATYGFQQASGGPGERTAASQDYRMFGTWHAINWEEGRKGEAGNVYFRLEYRGDFFADITPVELAGSIGSMHTTTYGFDAHDFALVQLYYEQFLADGKLRLRAGKLDPDDYYNLGRWADDYRYFMNTLFSAFPGANHPSGGLGFAGQWYVSPEWTVTGGFHDVQGRKTESGFTTFFEDFDLLAAVDVTWSPTIEGWGRGNYRIGFEHRDASERKGTPEDNGFYINIDQEVAKDVAPFIRFWHGEGDATGIETVISGGLGIDNCFGNAGDAFGVGVGAAFPKDDTLARDVEYGTEVFYRFQLTRAIQWTVGYQAIFDPVLNPDQSAIGIFEMRLLIEF